MKKFLLLGLLMMIVLSSFASATNFSQSGSWRGLGAYVTKTTIKFSYNGSTNYEVVNTTFFAHTANTFMANITSLDGTVLYGNKSLVVGVADTTNTITFNTNISLTHHTYYLMVMTSAGTIGKIGTAQYNYTNGMETRDNGDAITTCHDAMPPPAWIGFNVLSVISEDYINLSIPQPANNTNFTPSTPQVVHMNLTMNNTYTTNCSLYFNSSSVINQTKQYTNGTNNLVDFNISGLGDANYTYFIRCLQSNDSTQNETTLTYNFQYYILDATPPTASYTIPVNTTVWYNNSGTTCLNFTVTDENLVYSSLFTWQNLVDPSCNGSSNYSAIDNSSFTNTDCFVGLDVCPAGNISWNHTYCDTHTTTALTTLSVDKTIVDKGSITLNKDFQVLFSVFDGLKIVDKVDRLSFEYDIKELKPYTITIKGDRIVWVKNSKYANHAVIDDKYWFDTEGVEGTILIDEKTNILTITPTKTGVVKMESVGEINCVTDTGNFSLLTYTSTATIFNGTFSTSTCPSSSTPSSILFVGLLGVGVFLIFMGLRWSFIGLLAGFYWICISIYIYSCSSWLALILTFVGFLVFIGFVFKKE